MPARDHSLALRGAVTKALRDAARVSDLVAQRVHAEQPPNPTWPWVRVGPVRVTPFEATGAVGGDAGWMVHTFTDDGALAHRLNAAVVYTLDEQRLPLEPEEGDDPDNPPYLIELLWQGSEVMADTAREGGYHGVVRFTATTAEGV